MALFIKAVLDGFRRAGIAHSRAGAYYPDDRFSEGELEALKGEPQLIVIEGVEEPEKDGSNENEGVQLEVNGQPTVPAPGKEKPKTTGPKTGPLKAKPVTNNTGTANE